jgi:ribosomal protein S18 acetylase RimI-like enzyme
MDKLADVKISKPAAEVEVISAAQFSIAELTDIYNQTRVDYLVPMPMSERKMREYAHNYDIDFSQSAVAVRGNEPLGLALLGVREDTTWVTRMGVAPNTRQKGVGQKLMDKLIDNSGQMGAKLMTLDVIKGNKPAEHLFTKSGFQPVRDLLIARRPPKPVDIVTHGTHIEVLGYRDAVKLLGKRQDTPSWLTSTRSMVNAGNLSALYADLPNGGKGWVVYQNTVFQLGRLVFKIEAGDPTEVATALLENMHWRHPVQDTIYENFSATAPYWSAMQKIGYIVSFMRIEMKKPLA